MYLTTRSIGTGKRSGNCNQKKNRMCIDAQHLNLTNDKNFDNIFFCWNALTLAVRSMISFEARPVSYLSL